MLNLMKTSLMTLAAGALLVTSAVAAGLQLEPVGSVNLEFHSTGITDNQRITGTFMGGTITLGDGQGTVQGCIEDGYVRGSGNIEFDLRCHVTMDDGAVLLMSYAGVIVQTPTFWDALLGAGASPGNGMSYWVSRKKMSTTSEKYSWVNDYIIVGDGKFLKGPSEAGPGQVVYDLYRIKH
tara:strand:- start:351 stop:890 length:540 start_codon:yes stop_codon:yes gene_type:complete